MNATNIPWADFTWNPTTGCTFGCEWCYARGVAARFSCTSLGGNEGERLRVARLYDKAFETHSRRPFPAEFYPTLYARRLDEPLRRKKPAVIFLGSMGDVFDPAIPDEFRDRIFATVAAAHWHTFVVLTKRAGAMRDYFTGYIAEFGVLQRVMSVMHGPMPANLVIGVSVTNQADADERIPLLLDTPAAKRMVSVEPMLGPVDLDGLWGYAGSADSEQLAHWPIHFVAVGGKTPGKPLHEQDDCGSRDASCDADYCSSRMPNTCPASWLRSLRDQCLAAGVPFHYKHGGTNPALDGVVYNAAVPR